METKDDGKKSYQGVNIKAFETALDVASRAKNDLIEIVKSSISERLEDGESKMHSLSALILNTEGWITKEDDEFLDEEINSVCELLQEPLGRAGLAATLNEVLEQWHSMVTYAVTYLNVVTFHYRKVWKLLFSSSRSREWKDILLMVELLFCLPISNAKVERFFSLLNRVKTDGRASLGEARLNSLLRICTEGPEIENFDASNALQLWANDVVRRPNQRVRENYKKRMGKEKPQTLIDIPLDANSKI